MVFVCDLLNITHDFIYFTESVNMRMTYGEWDKIKDQTLAALYDQNPDIDKLFSWV